MKTIYLTRDKFEQFINKKYHVIEGAGRVVKREFEITLKQEHAAGEVVFLSSVDKIRFPDAGIIPQLKTLYGIPSGLMELNSDKTTGKSVAKNQKNWVLSLNDLMFVALRRAMLYVHAWSIKGFDMESVRLGMSYFLREPVLHLLKNWLPEFVNAGKYPEVKPPKVTLDHTQYDFQFIGMGVLLRNYFFDGLETMPADHREWLLKSLNVANLSNVPEKFAGIEGILAGYLIALKASNLNMCNLDFILDKASKFKISDRSLHYGVIISALFFIGIFDSKANMYFYAASAGELMKRIESFCFEMIFTEVKSPEFGPAYDLISDAILNPIPNVFGFYKLKNPAIANHRLVEFDNQQKIPDDNNIVTLLIPRQAASLLEKSGKLWMSANRGKHQLAVTADETLFGILVQKGLPAVLVNRKGLTEGHFSISKHSEIVADSPLIARWLKRYFPTLKVSNTLLKQPTASHWVIISDEFRIPDDELFFALRMNAKPASVTVFNFANRPMPVKTEVMRTVKKKKGNNAELFETADAVAVSQVNKGSNSQLQAYLEGVVPSVPVRVITRYHQEPPWEMVMLGIGALQDVDFSGTTLFDMRKNKSVDEPFEIVLRCFRDLIVYDKDQRYMFMNLT